VQKEVNDEAIIKIIIFLPVIGNYGLHECYLPSYLFEGNI